MDADKRHETSRSEVGTAIARAGGSAFYIPDPQTPIPPKRYEGGQVTPELTVGYIIEEKSQD